MSYYTVFGHLKGVFTALSLLGAVASIIMMIRAKPAKQVPAVFHPLVSFWIVCAVLAGICDFLAAPLDGRTPWAVYSQFIGTVLGYSHRVAQPLGCLASAAAHQETRKTEPPHPSRLTQRCSERVGRVDFYLELQPCFAPTRR